MQRFIASRVARDLARKMVFLTGPRQAGKTTLALPLAEKFPGAQVLNWDVLADRRVILAQSWAPAAKLLVFDELHKMRDWKPWLTGVFDGRAPGQSILVTGSARLEAFRQRGESLAGRYFVWHLQPVTVREWQTAQGMSPERGPDATDGTRRISRAVVGAARRRCAAAAPALSRWAHSRRHPRIFANRRI